MVAAWKFTLRRVGTGSGRGREVGGELGSEDGGTGRGYEILGNEGGEESILESCGRLL